MATNQLTHKSDAVIGETLLTESEIQQRVKELGKQITQDFEGVATPDKPLIVLGVLKGVLFFLADLMREVNVPNEIHFIDISAAKNSSGHYQELPKYLAEAINNRHVLFVEDIVDAGLTLSYVSRILYQGNPESVSVCTLLSKEANRIMDVTIHYTGFEIEPVYVIGYGLDFNEQYRNLPYIGVLKK